jgi:transposase
MDTRKPYPSDVSDEEWAFVAPYLALVREDAPQREHDLREVFNGLRWVVRTGSPWRYMPHDLPPWEALYQQTQRWLKAGVFEEMVHDLRVLFLRLSEGLAPEPTAAILDSRAPCVLLRRAALGAATTGPSARRAPRCTRRWTLWGICSPCM